MEILNIDRKRPQELACFNFFRLAYSESQTLSGETVRSPGPGYVIFCDRTPRPVANYKVNSNVGEKRSKASTDVHMQD